MTTPRTTPISKKTRQKSQTRENIIAAAWKVMADVGFEKANITTIVDEAGISRPTFYANFRNLDDVVLVMSRTVREDLHLVYRTLDSLDSPTHDDMAAWLETLAGVWKKHRVIFAAISTLMYKTTEATEVLSASMKKQIENSMPRHLARLAEPQRGEFLVRVMMFRTLVERFYFITIIKDAPLPVDGSGPLSARFLADIWINEIHGKLFP